MAIETATRTEASERREALVGRLFMSTVQGAEVLSVYLGDRLGLYEALRRGGPLTARELAARAGTSERYTREWLEQQAIAGFLDVDDTSASDDARRYQLPDEFADVFLDPDSPVHVAPLGSLLASLGAISPALVDAFRSGGGLSYDAFGSDARQVQEQLNRPFYTGLLANVWFPQIPDVHARLLADPPARVADIGCGAGWASIAIARAYPNVMVDGFDVDEPSIALARANAIASGVADRVHFHVRDAADAGLRGQYDLVAAFMMLHDVARPVETLRVIRGLATTDGAVLVLDGRVDEEFRAPGDPVQRLWYVSSVFYCLPQGLNEQPSAGTGTVMRPALLRRYAREAGFGDVSILPIEHDLFRLYRLR
jgi:SAM-dependent methyltransferase